MINLIASALGVVGQGIKGFFGVKESQVQSVGKAIDAVKHLSSDDATTKQAAASVIVAEAQSGYWLAAAWRPLLMVIFASLIIARWFGYMPPNMTETEVFKLYDLMELGIGGYIGGRTLEKIATSINYNSVLKNLLK